MISEGFGANLLSTKRRGDRVTKKVVAVRLTDEDLAHVDACASEASTSRAAYLEGLARADRHGAIPDARRFVVDVAAENRAAMVAKGPHLCSVRPAKKEETYPYKNERLTRKQLAERAGCSYAAMHERLQRKTPEEAVDMGPTHEVIPLVAEGREPAVKLYEYEGQKYNITQLATLKGISHAYMRKLIKQHGVDGAMNATVKKYAKNA